MTGLFDMTADTILASLCILAIPELILAVGALCAAHDRRLFAGERSGPTVTRSCRCGSSRVAGLWIIFRAGRGPWPTAVPIVADGVLALHEDRSP